MAAVSAYAENAVLNHLFRNVALPSPSNVYVALHNGSPTNSGAANQIAIARGLVTFSAPVNGVMLNNNMLTFDSMPETTVTHVSIWDSPSGGNALWYGALLVQRAVASGEAFVIPQEKLQVELA